MPEIVSFFANMVLIILVIGLVFATYRIWTGPSVIERLQALDLTSTIFVAIVIVLGIVLENSQFIDIGIALAAFSFVSTLAIARFVSEGRFF
jgi:Multisubunit Na+/H+ antiporter, MnhF subunit